MKISVTGIPFRFRGMVSATSADRRAVVVDLIGAGSAAVDLGVVTAPYEPFAFVDGVVYTFEKTPTPVPEPTSLLLIGSGFVAMVARRPHRKRVRDADGDRVSS